VLVEVKVPQLAESVTEATLLEWQKQQGDTVARGDNLIDIETDKVVLEVTAADDGVLKEIKKHSGDDVASNEVIAIIDTQGAAAKTSPDQSRGSKTEPRLVEIQRTQTKAEPKPAPSPTSSEGAARSRNAAPAEETELAAGPAVRKLLEERQLDAREIAGSGKRGRITKADVIAHLESEPAAEAPAPSAEAVTEPVPMPDAAARPERRVAMTRLRKRVAERLLQAQREHAILTTFNEVDMQPIMNLRKRYREPFEKLHGVRLGFMGFFVMASIEALKRYPIVNASVDGNDIIYHGYFDIGIAVSSPRGLVVPILRDAHRMSMAEIEKAIADFGRKAKDNTLTLEELTGGTFTITNGGVFGSLLSTPILNPPQSAILGMHKVEDRPIARDGEVLIRPMMYLALSYDHRIIDGREAVQFLVTIKDQIEDPSRLLLQV
jgi:2-oxoglutarate dehydrogenase E2 component (dihydrolipoamide succinyltransferase)